MTKIIEEEMDDIIVHAEFRFSDKTVETSPAAFMNMLNDLAEKRVGLLSVRFHVVESEMVVEPKDELKEPS